MILSMIIPSTAGSRSNVKIQFKSFIIYKDPIWSVWDYVTIKNMLDEPFGTNALKDYIKLNANSKGYCEMSLKKMWGIYYDRELAEEEINIKSRYSNLEDIIIFQVLTL